MARSRPRYETVYLQHSLDRWFTERQRVFVYHYVNKPEVDAAWKDISSTGCRYQGWTVMSNFHRGEIWTYPTQKHLLLVQMLITRDQLITRNDWQRIKAEHRARTRQWDRELQGLIARYGAQYTWWEQEK